MNYNMTTKYVHSIKVPRLYKESAKAVKKVSVDGASFKGIVFSQNHPNVQGIYALVSETLQHCKELQSIIDKTEILIENPRFDPWLARVLITELLWGKKDLKSEAKPVQTVLSYREKLQQALMQNSDAAVDPCDKIKVRLPRYVRVNTLLMSIDEALNAFYEEGWNLLTRCCSYTSHLETISSLNSDDYIQDFHIPEVFIFPSGTKFHNHPGYLKGKLLLQDKASCLPAFLLNPKPNSEILDMCAAPGMKTTHLAAVINNKGKIYAVEMNENRYKTLCEFVSQTNAECIDTIQADALTITPEQYPNIKYILVDPSCSGSGMQGRFNVKEQDEENLYYRLRKLQSLQSMILTHALLDFPNVKKVIYSTCSIYPEENECVVNEVLRKVCNKFTLVNLKKKLKNEWCSFGSSEYSFNGDKCLYALPDKDFCSGFFVAMFKRKSGLEDNSLQESTSEMAESNSKHLLEMNEDHKIPLKKFKKDISDSDNITEEATNGEYKKVKADRIDAEENAEINEIAQKKSKKNKSVSKKVKSFMEENRASEAENVDRETDTNHEDPTRKVKKEKKKKKKDKLNLEMNEE